MMEINVILIANKEEFEKVYPYDKKYIEIYPKEYPCVCKIDWVDYGIMGDAKIIKVAYYPKDVSIKDAFVLGLSYHWETLNKK